ncbi:MAG: YdhR family protein [Chloroflexota bacterium]|nr:YdhR family protein [Chloroflexota bacterium]
MSGRIMQLNFKFSVSGAEYEQAVGPLADQFATLPGLRWKIWMINEEEREAGGIYLFEDVASVQAFLEGPLAAQVISHPALSDFSVKQFDVMEDLTTITRGPVAERTSV